MSEMETRRQHGATSEPTDLDAIHDEAERSRISRLFDIRLVIGGLLSLYGVVLVVKGALDGASALDRTGGLRINLWTGIGLLVVGALFLLWARLSPLQPPTTEELSEELDSPPDA
jgi:hypothetical protein